MLLLILLYFNDIITILYDLLLLLLLLLLFRYKQGPLLYSGYAGRDRSQDGIAALLLSPQTTTANTVDLSTN